MPPRAMQVKKSPRLFFCWWRLDGFRTLLENLCCHPSFKLSQSVGMVDDAEMASAYGQMGLILTDNRRFGINAPISCCSNLFEGNGYCKGRTQLFPNCVDAGL